MEKAIKNTLVYADIFDFPMKVWEIHKWLIGKSASLKQVEKAVKKMSLESIHPSSGGRVQSLGDFYCLPGRISLVKKRLNRQNQSKKYLSQIKFISQFFKLIPWIKLVGVSGSLAMDNCSKKDDIDLFVITSESRLFLSRFLLLFIVSVIGKRRKRREQEKNIAGKICINTLLEEDSLAQDKENIYLAHEILQMRVLWQRDGIYQKFLEQNSWVFKYLPNWISTGNIDKKSKIKMNKLFSSKMKNDRSKLKIFFDFYILIFDLFEKIAKFFQLRYMGKPIGNEKILDTALYFHPQDNGAKVLEEYRKKVNLNGFGHSR